MVRTGRQWHSSSAIGAQGKPLPDIAPEPIGVETTRGTGVTASRTRCCRSLFGRLDQTVSWDLAALQTLSFREELERLSEGEQRRSWNLPARAGHGVSTEEALPL